MTGLDIARLVFVYIFLGLGLVFWLVGLISTFRFLEGWRVTEKTLRVSSLWILRGTISLFIGVFIIMPEGWPTILVMFFAFSLILGLQYYFGVRQIRLWEEGWHNNWLYRLLMVFDEHINKKT